MAAKEAAVAAIDGHAPTLKELGSELWSRPELAFQEKHAHALLAQFLQERGFQVEKHFSLSTAFRATWGGRRPGRGSVAVICEYDALPDIGHACGHNLIAEAGVAAGLGIQAAIQSCPELEGCSVTVLGCPAEEGGGGKILMIDSGCFTDVDCALMVHPFTQNAVIINALARSYHIVKFTTPSTEETTEDTPLPSSPLDAAVLAYTSLSMLRQQLRPSWMLHGVISNGGKHPNIRPVSSEMLYYFRAPTHAELEVLQRKACECFEAAAKATGCAVSITEKARTYKDVVSNPTLANLFLENAQALGIEFSKETQNFSASTDMGNVSHILPSLHPVYSIGTSAVIHTRDFAAAANSTSAHSNTLLVAKAMALTGIDVLRDPRLMLQVTTDFQQQPPPLTAPA